MILNFDEYNETLIEDVDFDGFDYLNESMSISMEVRDTVKDVVKVINNIIKNHSVKKKHIDDTHPYDILNIPADAHMKIFGRELSLSDIRILNFSDIDDKRRSNAGVKQGVKYNGDGVSEVKFSLYGDFIAFDGRLTDFSTSLLAHELRHAYVFFKIYDGYEKSIVEQKRDLSKKWMNIYDGTTKYLKLYNRNSFVRMFDGKDFYRILFSIYRCDVSEIAAFTQQAYEKCGDCKSKSEIYSKMKDTDLHRLLKSFEDVQNMLCDKNVRELYDLRKKSYTLDDLPSPEKLIKLIRKRYDKARTNYGNVIVLLVDELEGFDGSEIIEVR